MFEIEAQTSPPLSTNSTYSTPIHLLENLYQTESKLFSRLMRPPGHIQPGNDLYPYSTKLSSLRQIWVLPGKSPQAEPPKISYDTVFRPDSRHPTPTLLIPSVMVGITASSPCLIPKELSTLGASKSSGTDLLHPTKMPKWLATFATEPFPGF